MRVSSYEFFVHFKPEGKTLLFNGLYGSMDIVSLKTGLNLEQSQIAKTSSVHIIDDDLETESILLQRKHITNMSELDEINLCKRAIERYEHAQIANDAAGKFTILITYDCNFCCPYCYEHTRERECNLSSSKGIISREQVDAIFDIINEHPYLESKQQIELFGGEPLFSKTLPIVSYIVEKAYKAHRTIAATTNGFDLDLFEDYLGPNKISDLIITIDGPEEIHNNRRVSKTGEKTFTKIVNNVQTALNKGVTVRIRVNLDRSNIQKYADLVRYFLNMGFFEYDNFIFAYGLIKTFPGNENKLVISESEAIEILENNLDNKTILQKALAETGGDTLDHFLDNSIIANSKTRYCGAVGASIFFSPDGLLYTCNEVVGEKKYSIGSYDVNGLHIDPDKEQLWRGRRMTNLAECHSCQLALVCSGGCPYRAIVSGNPFGPYCDDAKETLASRLRSQVRLAGLLTNT